MRKFFVIFTPIAILSIFVLIMLSGEFLKKPRGDCDNVPKHMDAITKAVLSDDWISNYKAVPIHCCNISNLILLKMHTPSFKIHRGVHLSY